MSDDNQDRGDQKGGHVYKQRSLDKKAIGIGSHLEGHKLYKQRSLDKAFVITIELGKK